jgi:uncharacterized membrane protein YkvA (DUF1232 family)
MDENAWEPDPDTIPPSQEPVTEYDRVMAQFKISAKRLPRYGRLAASMLRDDQVPPAARGALVVGGAYVISPIDLIPGFIPILGQLDDLLVALLGLRFALAQSPEDVRDAHLQRAGLREEDFAEDLRTVGDTSLYLVKAGARRTLGGVSRIARSAGRRLRGVTDRGTTPV